MLLRRNKIWNVILATDPKREWSASIKTQKRNNEEFFYVMWKQFKLSINAEEIICKTRYCDSLEEL